MKATGVIRRIDELGRIVIPKEIRKSLNIKEGTSLEIFVEDNAKLILQKVEELSTLPFNPKTICLSLCESLALPVFISDTENIIASSKKISSEEPTTKICNIILKILQNRKTEVLESKPISFQFDNYKIDLEKYTSLVVFPIIIDSLLFGGIYILNTDELNLPNIKNLVNLVLSLVNNS